MAASIKSAARMQLDWWIDRDTYNDFVKKCSSKGFAPQIIVEKMMKKYLETGQI